MTGQPDTDLFEQLDLDQPGWAAVVEDWLLERGHPRLWLVPELEVSLERLWTAIPRGARADAVRDIARRCLAVHASAEERELLLAVVEGDRPAWQALGERSGRFGFRVHRSPAAGLARAMRSPGRRHAWVALLRAMCELPAGRPAAVRQQLRALLRLLPRLRRLVGPELGPAEPRRYPEVSVIAVDQGWLVAPQIRLPDGGQWLVRRRRCGLASEALGALVLEQLPRCVSVPHARGVPTRAGCLGPFVIDAADVELSRRYPWVNHDAAPAPKALVRAAGPDRLWLHGGEPAAIPHDRRLGHAALGARIGRLLRPRSR